MTPIAWPTVFGAAVRNVYFLLVSRQVIVYLTYAILPLLLAFWLFDIGPMKYGKQLSEKLFKATGMLIPMGLVLAATAWLAAAVCGAIPFLIAGFGTPSTVGLILPDTRN